MVSRDLPPIFAFTILLAIQFFRISDGRLFCHFCHQKDIQNNKKPMSSIGETFDLSGFLARVGLSRPAPSTARPSLHAQRTSESYYIRVWGKVNGKMVKMGLLWSYLHLGRGVLLLCGQFDSNVPFCSAGKGTYAWEIMVGKNSAILIKPTLSRWRLIRWMSADVTWMINAPSGRFTRFLLRQRGERLALRARCRTEGIAALFRGCAALLCIFTSWATAASHHAMDLYT